MSFDIVTPLTPRSARKPTSRLFGKKIFRQLADSA